MENLDISYILLGGILFTFINFIYSLGSIIFDFKSDYVRYIYLVCTKKNKDIIYLTGYKKEIIKNCKDYDFNELEIIVYNDNKIKRIFTGNNALNDFKMSFNRFRQFIEYLKNRMFRK